MSEKLFENNYEALYAYAILEECGCVYLTGGAGTGKSTFIDWAINLSHTICYVVAPTGIAANNIGGETINSVFQLPNRLIMPSDKEFFSSQRFSEDKMMELFYADLIVIDEISMVTSATLDCIDFILRNRCKDIPFGGKKVLLIGDPLQLPPVVTKEDLRKIKTEYKSEYFFESKVFRELDPVKIELKEIYRQKDKEFLEILNGIRIGKQSKSALSKLNKQCYFKKLGQETKSDNDSITLTFKKIEAENKNNLELEKLDGKEVVIRAWQRGDFKDSSCQAEHELRLKVGARIMLIKNDFVKKYVNGTLGVVQKIENNAITVLDDDNREILIHRYTWETKKSVGVKEKRGYSRSYQVVGSLSQFPIKLAWAITVHKSQGLTFNNVNLLNNTGVFAYGQTYVALSRCRTIEGLTISNLLKQSDIKVDPKLAKFDGKKTSEDRIELLIHEYCRKKEEAEQKSEVDAE